MTTSRTVWERNRLIALNRDSWQCQIRLDGCERDATDADHIRPRSAGGTNHPSNLRAACAHCNRARGGGGKRDPNDWADQLGRKRRRRGRQRIAPRWITPGGLHR